MPVSPPPSFSWVALLLAPWPAALASCLVFTSGSGEHPLSGFLLVLTLIMVFAYTGTATLAGCVALLARRGRVDPVLCGVLGLLLAGFGYAVILYVTWSSGGPDSGPPTESLWAHVQHDWNDPFLYHFLGNGLVSAVLYGLLVRQSARLSRPATGS